VTREKNPKITEGEKFKRATLTVALVTNFVNPFAATALNIAIPMIGSEFHASATTLGWVVSAFMFFMVAFAVPFGRVADTKGRIPVLVFGVIVFAAGAFLAGFAPSLTVLIAFRILQGIGSAIIYSTNMAILIEVYPSSERGRVLGISVAAVYLGSSLGPVIGGEVTHYLGWRYVLFLTGALAIFALVNILLRMPIKALKEIEKAEKIELNETRPQKIGVSSIVLYACAMLLVMYGFTTLGQNIASYIILVAGAALFIVYVKHEAKTEAPIVEVRLFRNPNFLLSNLAALFNYAATFAVGYLLSIYLQLVKGYSANISGLILIAQPVVQMIISPISGRMSDHRNPFKLASIGMALCAVALFCLGFIRVDTPVYLIIGILLILGFGFGFFTSPNSNAIMSSVEPRDFGVANSIQSTARSFGQVIGMAMITIITNIIIGHSSLDEASAGTIVRNTNTAFFVFAAVCALGIVISLQRKPHK